MKKATFAALLLSALASGYGVTCHAATYDYTQAMGSLELEFSEESGDPIVTIETVNPNNGSTCSFESEGCRFDEDGLTCFSESGDLVLKYRDDDLIEVTAEPDGMCGLNATMLGYYTPREESSAPSLYRPTSGEGSLQLEFSEDSGDPIVTIETVNPNNGSTCSWAIWFSSTVKTTSSKLHKSLMACAASTPRCSAPTSQLRAPVKPRAQP